MTRADGDLFVPTTLRSILIIIIKEGSFEFMTKTDCGWLIYTKDGGKELFTNMHCVL